MNQTSPHPDESQLRGLLRGTLGSADEAAVLAQLEREPAWQAALDRLVADQATWRAAAESLQKPPLAADRTLRSVLAQWSARSASGNSDDATTSAGDTSAHGVSGPHGDDADHSRDLRFLAPSDDPSYLGKLGTYLVEEVIGCGGFGVVLKARDPKLARIVAIKVLAAHLATSGTACERFKREARAAAAVTHEHVITIYAVESEPLPYLVMQYIAGISLQDKLDREGPLGVKETLRIGMQTAAGLAAAHKQGLVHRDIKPANILLENGIERVKLTDFGLARAADDASLTRSGTIAGTPQYMSPEQARGETVDVRSDLFSLGTVLYAMLTGRSPFRADSTLAVLKRVCDDPPRPIREVNPDVPEWLAALIDRLLAKAPADRPASAQEVADQLGQYLLQMQQPRSAIGKELPMPSFAKPIDISPLPDESPMLAKPAKLDPFVDAPPVPRRSRVATVLLGLGLLLVGVMALACMGLVGSYAMHRRPSSEAILQNSRPLTINIPDRRLTATLRLQRAEYQGGYPMVGVAIPDMNHTLQIVSGDTYRLMAGQYELTVKSDDVTVFSDAIHIQPDAIEPKVYEVKPGGILNLEVQPVQFDRLCVDVNGHSFIKDATLKSQRMLVVPEGAMRIKTYASHHVYAEKWLELKAGEEITVRVSRESIEVILPPAAKPAGAAAPAAPGG